MGKIRNHLDYKRYTAALCCGHAVHEMCTIGEMMGTARVYFLRFVKNLLTYQTYLLM